jgi:hypothetical protein
MGLKLQRLVLGSALPARLRFLTTVLALYGDEDGGNIYPSIDRLAREIDVHRTGVMLKLKELRSLGVLVVERKGGGRRRPTLYRLVIDALPVAAENRRDDATVSERRNSSAATTESKSVKRLTGATHNSETVAPAPKTVALMLWNGSAGATQQPGTTKEQENHQRDQNQFVAPVGATLPGWRSSVSKDTPEAKVTIVQEKPKFTIEINDFRQRVQAGRQERQNRASSVSDTATRRTQS